MKDKPIVSGTDLENHRKESPKTAHGIFSALKTYIDGMISVENEDPIDDEMTFDSTWRSFDCNTKTSYNGQSFVILGIHCQAATAGCYAWIQTNRYGVSSGYRHYFHARGSIENLDEDPAENHDGGEVIMPLDAGRFNYKGDEDVGTVSVKINGYIR